MALGLLLFFISSTSKAAYLGLAVKKPGPGYFKAVISRFYSWYSENYYNFAVNLTSNEKELIASAIDRIDASQEYIDQRTNFPKLRFYLEGKDGQLFYSGVMVITNLENKKEKSLVLAILAKNRVSISQDELKNLFAISFSKQLSEFSVYYLKKDKNEDVIFHQEIYRGKRNIDSCVWQKSEDVSESQFLFAKNISDFKKIECKKSRASYIFSNDLPTKLISDKLEMPLRKIGKEFGFSPQTVLIENQNNFKIYYQ